MDAEQETKSLGALKESARKQYNAFINPIWCESVRAKIFFNAKGFHHIVYNGLGHKRQPAEQFRRLRLVSNIMPILKANLPITHRYAATKNTRYWGIDAKISENPEKKVRLVLRQLGKGRITFWSIMELNTK